MGNTPRNKMGGMFNDYVSLPECKLEWPSGWYQSSIVSWCLKVFLWNLFQSIFFCVNKPCRILSTWRSICFINKNIKEVKSPKNTFRWLNAWLVKRRSHLGWKHILSNQLNGVNIHLKTDTNIHPKWMLGIFSPYGFRLSTTTSTKLRGFRRCLFCCVSVEASFTNLFQGS